ncbi:T9SS type A sorting domain-containing protein [Seonamhaeicola algicola]|uniref:T9SS type A sorting domain-containing protein n=1 Tax=Seonamhaeicola algicola TaxID=1719036 RepID=A0A5C7AN86_9FLAO|nr:T9SS type A sorting domain-containing protein [Seonamhaeicola algicola]TXE10088.1 T9SS type A sorting domain-containing protein [Seonamhaeicola algicola]
MKKITFLLSLMVTCLTFSQTITVTSVPDIVARNTSMPAATGAMVTKYIVDFVNIPIADGENSQFFSGWVTGTDATGTAVGGGRTITATNNGGTIDITGVATVNSSQANGDGTFNYTVSFDNLNAFGNQPDYDAQINYGGTAFPGAIASNRVVSVIESAPASLDEYSFDFSGDLVQNTSVDIAINYVSDEPVQIGAIEFTLVGAKNPYEPGAEITVGTYSNTSILPAAPGGASATITMNNFPSNFSVGGSINGVLLASKDPSNPSNAIPSQLYDANPWGLANRTNVYYFLNPLSTSVDPEWAPASLPSRKFFGILENPSLSTEDFSKNSISNLITSSNPVTNRIDLTTSGDYRIFNLTGVEVKSGKFSNSINVESLNQGLYFLSIEEGVYKFIKK